jgi:2-phosphosulfolactate phosphatase
MDVVSVDLSITFAQPESFRGSTTIMIDNLRASVTITAALASGASRVVACGSVDDAFLLAAAFRAGGNRVVLGGERGGLRIDGFDLGNSPKHYTTAAVGGATVIFTTTNGTRALLAARAATRVLVGSLVNLSAVCDEAMKHGGAIRILCAGTDGHISADDVLPAGAMVERLAGAKVGIGNDEARVARSAFLHERADDGGIDRAMLDARGGAGLARIGLGDDVPWCSRIDSIPVVPVARADTMHGVGCVDITLAGPTLSD